MQHDPMGSLVRHPVFDYAFFFKHKMALNRKLSSVTDFLITGAQHKFVNSISNSINLSPEPNCLELL